MLYCSSHWTQFDLSGHLLCPRLGKRSYLTFLALTRITLSFYEDGHVHEQLVQFYYALFQAHNIAVLLPEMVKRLLGFRVLTVLHDVLHDNIGGKAKRTAGRVKRTFWNIFSATSPPWLRTSSISASSASGETAAMGLISEQQTKTNQRMKRPRWRLNIPNCTSRIVFSRSFLSYLVRRAWYCCIRSRNLRTSVPCMFVLIFTSDGSLSCVCVITTTCGVLACILLLSKTWGSSCLDKFVVFYAHALHLGPHCLCQLICFSPHVH